MPQSLPAVFAAVKAWAATHATAIAVVKVALVVASVAYTVRSNQIAKQRAKQAAREAQGITQMVRNSTAPVANVYGERRVSGPIVFVQEEGVDRKNLHMVIVLAPHECQEIKWIWFDDQVVSFDPTTGAVTSGNFATAAWVWTKNGAPGQTAFENLVAECPTLWNVQCKLEGCAAVYVKLAFDQKIYSNGLPNISATVRGKKLYDYRDAQTRWSANPALIAADILTDTYIGAGVPREAIDAASVIEAANICDETVEFPPPAYTDSSAYRYSCHFVMDSASRLEDHLQTAVDCMAGWVTRSSGKWFIRAGSYRTPTLTFTDSDFLSELSISPRRAKAALCNNVRGVFVDPKAGYVAAEFPPVKNPVLTMEDNGEELWLDMDLGATIDPSQAQRLAHIELQRSRQQISVQVELGLRGLQIMPGDTIMLTVPRMGWTSKVFEVTSWVLDMSGSGVDDNPIRIGVALQETAPIVFANGGAEAHTNPEELPDLGGVDLSSNMPPGWDADADQLGGLYCNLIDIPENLPGGLLFSSIDVNTALVGFDQFVGTIPPSRFMTATVANTGGPGTIQNYAWNDPCAGTEPKEMWQSGVSMTGVIQIDPMHPDNDITHTGALSYSVTDWGCGFGPVITNSFDQHYGVPRIAPFGYEGANTSPILYTVTPYSGCWQAACGILNKNATTSGGGWTVRLSNEFTEDDAVARAIEINSLTWSEWSEAANVSAWYARTTGFEVHKIQTKFKGSWTGGLPFWVYQIQVGTETRAYGSSDPWEEDQTYTWDTTPGNLDGDIEIDETLIPCERGRETRVAWWSISAGC